MKKQDLKILLVEDDISTRATIRSMLLEMGITQIYEAEDGQTASDFIEMGVSKDKQLIDLVISDWNMPKKTGYEFLVALRKAKPDLPFLMVTARGDHSSMMDAIGAGVTSYIRKPFSLKELEEKIDDAVA